MIINRNKKCKITDFYVHLVMPILTAAYIFCQPSLSVKQPLKIKPNQTYKEQVMHTVIELLLMVK